MIHLYPNAMIIIIRESTAKNVTLIIRNFRLTLQSQNPKPFLRQ